MIIKNFELQKINSSSSKIFLLYGSNEGFKNQVIKDFFANRPKYKINRLDENEILNNYENFISELMNKSFFEEKKIIIVSRTTEKIIKLVFEIMDRKISDIIFILNASILEKRSKLRTFFEKEKDLICIPFYDDDAKKLTNIAINFFREKKITISQENINLIVDRCNGDRKNLNNELDKIEHFIQDKKKITLEEIIKLTNLAENYSISELTDNCLSKNLKNTVKILNENNFTYEDCIVITRSLLSKSKRVLELKKNLDQNRNIEQTIASFKPPIFWKDKEIVKKQIENWSKSEVGKLIYKINDIELLIKKNSINSLNILSDFLLSTSKKSIISLNNHNQSI